MATHEADSGPSAKRYLSNAGTGLSPAGASFISANCSPFSPPHEIVTGPPKVPDPRHHERSCTAYLWDTFQLPVTSTGQIVYMNADPLAPLPIAWAVNSTNPNPSTTPALNPRDWAVLYEQNGLSELVSNIKALAENSSRHRVVGCGLKAWVTKDASIQSRGIIEAGQFRVSKARFRSPIPGVALRSTGQEISYSHTGAFGTALNYPYADYMRSSIDGARDREMFGMLPADEGVTLRWTDSNNFEYQDSAYRSLIVPTKVGYSNGYMPYASVFNFVTDGTSTGGFAGRVQHDATASPGVGTGVFQDTTPEETAQAIANTYYLMPTDVPSNPTLLTSSTSKLGCIFRNGTINPSASAPSITTPCTLGYTGNINFACADASNFPGAYSFEAQPAMKWADDNANFGNALFADISGVDIGQYIQIQVVWHIEYIPTFNALDKGVPSPVDMNYEELAVIASDPVAFPVVVKGHSFFKSLIRGIKQAATGAARVLGIASDIAKVVPIPQVQAAGTMMGMGSTIAGGISTVF